MKHIFILNPCSGGGMAEKKYLPEILKAVKKHNVEYEIHRSLSKGDIIHWVHERASQGDAVRFYAIGGDGTVNDVVSGMMDGDKAFENAELSVIACGSGNDFARSWTGASDDIELLMQSGNSRSIDIIRVNDKDYCVNTANLGADCDIAVYASKIKDRFPGSASYVVAALKLLPNRPDLKMTYWVDEEEGVETDFLLCCLGNSKFCGGGFNSCPDADLTDGKMDMCLVSPIKGPKLVPLLLQYRLGKHTSKKYENIVKYRQIEKLRIEVSEEVNLGTDGEPQVLSKASFQVCPKALRLVLPEGSKLITE